MGNFCERCLGRLDKRRYLRTRYNVERDISIEFANLMDEDPPEIETPKGQLEFDKPFTVSSYMKWLVHQDEELRREEEAYYQALQDEQTAAQEVKTSRRKEQLTKLASSRVDPNKWLGDNDSDWEMAGGEDDFDMFIECVKARSAAAQTRVINSQVPLDVASDTSSKDDRSKTEASSLDLEWEHEAGMQPLPRQKRSRVSARDPTSVRAVTDIAELAVQPMIARQPPVAPTSAVDDTDVLSDDFEWDSDFGAANNNPEENRTLMSKQGVATLSASGNMNYHR